MIVTVKAEGLIFSNVWDALSTYRRATFFSREFPFEIGRKVRWWRRRDGVKMEILTRVADVSNSTETLRRVVVEEIPEEDE